MEDTPTFNALLLGAIIMTHFPNVGVLILVAIGIVELAYNRFKK